MRSALSWLALHSDRMPDLLAPFALHPAQGAADHTDSDFAAAALPSGWLVLWANQYEPPEFGEAMLRPLSAKGDVLLAHVEENQLSASVEFWRQGERLWRVVRNAAGFQVDGDPPEAFLQIRAHHQQLQAEADTVGEAVDHLFEVPLALAQQLTGFRHDESQAIAFDLLNSDNTVRRPYSEVAGPHANAPAAKPWWRLW